MTGNPSSPEASDDPPRSPHEVDFHPHPARLLELLSSEAVYGTPLMAVRELVLNAFDAIRDRVTGLRLALPAAEDATDPKWERIFSEDLEVCLDVFRNRNGRFLRCSDPGPGLDESDITHRILSPGRPAGAARLSLDALCQARGFRLPGRTRRGLGFQSCFMLADVIKIMSQRASLTGGTVGRIVEFKSEGPRGRSLLRSRSTYQRKSAFTRVTLKLNEKATGDESEFDRNLRTLLQQTIVRTPCGLYLNWDLHFPPGWFPQRPEIAPRVVSRGPGKIGLKALPVTSAALDLITALRSIPPDDLPSAGVHLGSEIHEFNVPGLATLRCTAPWIAYRGIRAMVWATDAEPDQPADQYSIVALNHSSRTAWQGMHCELTGLELPGVLREPVDLGQGISGAMLPPWGFLTLDVDLDEPPVETLALNRNSVALTAETRSRLQEFCYKSLHFMAGHVRQKYPGTLLAGQMEEMETSLRRLVHPQTRPQPPREKR